MLRGHPTLAQLEEHETVIGLLSQGPRFDPERSEFVWVTGLRVMILA